MTGSLLSGAHPKLVTAAVSSRDHDYIGRAQVPWADHAGAGMAGTSPAEGVANLLSRDPGRRGLAPLRRVSDVRGVPKRVAGDGQPAPYRRQGELDPSRSHAAGRASATLRGRPSGALFSNRPALRHRARGRKHLRRCVRHHEGRGRPRGLRLVPEMSVPKAPRMPASGPAHPPAERRVPRWALPGWTSERSNASAPKSTRPLSAICRRANHVLWMRSP